MSIARLTCWFSLSLLLPAMGRAAPPADFPAGVVDRNQLSDARAVDYAFENVEIDKVEGWLKWAGIESPVDLSGQVTGWVWVQRSASGWFSFRDYRIEGELRASDLKIERWSVADAVLRFGYDSDTWYVGRLRGRITPPVGSRVAGDLESHVRLDTLPAPRLTLGGSLSAIDLKTLLAAFDVPFEFENQQGQLKFDARAPLSSVRDLRTWDATAAMQLREVAIPGLASPLQLAANVVLRNGQWQLNDTWLQSPDDRVTLTGNGSVEAPWTYSLSASGRDVSLARLFQDPDWNNWTENLSGLFSVEARITGDAQAGVELASLEAESKMLQIVDVVLRDAALKGQYSAGKLELDLQHVSIAGGVLSAKAAWDDSELLAKGIPSQLTLSVHQVDLRQLPRPDVIANGGGILDAELSFRADRSAGSPVQWQGTVAAQVRESIASGLALGDLQLKLSKPRSEASAEATLELTHNSSHLRSQVTFALQTPKAAVLAHSQLQSYVARGQAESFQLAGPIPGSSTSQPLQVTGDFEVSGDPQTWLRTGDATISDAETQIGGRTVSLQSLMLEFNVDEFRLRRFTISDTSGRISGAAILRRNAIGEHLLRLRGTKVMVAPYWDQFAPDYMHGLAGNIDFSTDLRVAANQADGLGLWKGTFDGEATQLSFRENELGRVRFTAKALEQQSLLQVAGEMLGAIVAVEAELPTNVRDLFTDEGAFNESLRFSADVRELQLKRVAAVIAGRRRANRIDGTASLTASGQLLDRQLSFGGQARIPNFVNARQPVCRDVMVDFKWDDRHFLIEQASGMVAGGFANVAGDVTWQDNRAPDGRFKFDVHGIELNRVVALLYPEQAAEVAGKISYRGQGRVNDGYHFDGAATAIDGLAFGIPLQQVRGNLSIAFGPDGALRQIRSSKLTGTVLGGRFLGDIQVRGGPSIELESVGRVDRGKLEQLSRALKFDHIVGRGIFKGQYAVQSKNLLALAALSGKLQVDFDDGDAQTVPILSDLNRLIPLMQLASTEITGGTMHALIGQGELRIQDLLLNSEAFWVAADGDASLASGRLDLQGVLQTGGGIEAQASQQLTKQLATLIVPQAILIAQIDNLLRNRTLYFRVGGSTGHPVIQPKVAPTVARVFLERIRRQLLIAPVTAVGISVDQ